MINVNKLFGEKRISDGQCIIYSIDSDVSLLAVHHFSYYENIIHMWVETGRSDLTKKTSTHRFVPTHHICQRLDPGLSEVLPAVAALTGGDEVSSFHFKGKKSTMKLIKKTKNQNQALTQTCLSSSTLLFSRMEALKSVSMQRDL